MVAYIPLRGHFIWLNFDPQAGYEQMGKRPALVVSYDAFNQKMGFAFVCPVSNTQRQNPFYVTIPEGDAVTGVIMTDQMRSLDFRARNATFISECPDFVLQDVLRRIKPIIF
ncbi:type II toxin-antitoxin system PemK/MazF family toxin [Merismopedia glauca]|uniref:Potassium-transporting ATPase subunit C n=1 Tax=Merismopedia glauca CCAP 1448/3 TaxID=1296344 RepID=A0A2T1C8G5_9CYAN|nr:type II toxin-antitoxin system PemK/MazF family toxin [Merismopedia glauca]PSB04448.1 potassium-transporting ATPase subunit C [Merismopedia glauca CCAP 1448/3]